MTEAQRRQELDRLQGEIVTLKAEIYDREVAIRHLHTVPAAEDGPAVDLPPTPDAESPRDEAARLVSRLAQLGYTVNAT